MLIREIFVVIRSNICNQYGGIRLRIKSKINSPQQSKRQNVRFA